LCAEQRSASATPQPESPAKHVQRSASPGPRAGADAGAKPSTDLRSLLTERRSGPAAQQSVAPRDARHSAQPQAGPPHADPRDAPDRSAAAAQVPPSTPTAAPLKSRGRGQHRSGSGALLTPDGANAVKDKARPDRSARAQQGKQAGAAKPRQAPAAGADELAAAGNLIRKHSSARVRLSKQSATPSSAMHRRFCLLLMTGKTCVHMLAALQRCPCDFDRTPCLCQPSTLRAGGVRRGASCHGPAATP
jgi:hypothetical protein